MNSLAIHRSFGRLLACLIFTFCIAGCANHPRVDWNSRIGSFTFDQAVIELGPPDKSAKLTDGTTVAEWLTVRGDAQPSFHVHSGIGLYRNYPSTFWIEDYVAYPGPSWYLRLTFGPDSKLNAWKRVVK
ncbi:MAG: hypothetical protein HY043_13445 [Verrucomicrobia bacterium]|nr:hypothetical protein [Verrucomicrobiota bacterium]